MKLSWTSKKLIIATLLFLNASIANAEEFSGHISGFIGLKTMDSSDWPDLDTHFSLGVIFDIKKNSWPVSIAVDILDTGDKHSHDGLEDLGHTTEYQLGVRKIFMSQDSKIQPYIGGGISFMYAEQELETTSTKTKEDDRDVGGWLGAGMYYEINPRFVVGLDARYSHGEVSLFNQEQEAGGIFSGVTIGYQF